MNWRNELAAAGRIIHHDQRLFWREMHRGEMGWLRSWLPLGVLFTLFQAPALALSWQLKQPPAPGVLTVGWFFIGLTMLGGAMGRALSLLFERSDLDLLLSSPLPAYTVLLGRLISIACTCFLAAGLFVLPIVNALLLRFGPRYLAAWLVWAQLALAMAALGTGTVLVLVRWLGLRRGKLTAQTVYLLVALAPMGIMLLPAVAPAGGQSDFKALLRLLGHPIWTIPGRASQGDPLALAGLGLLATGLVAGTAWLLGRTFVTGAQESAVRATPRRDRPHRWSEGLGEVIFRKELRLIARHPLILSQLLPLTVVIFLMGLVVIHVSHDTRQLAPLILYWCGVGPLQLSVFAAAGEVGWDLVRQSAVPPARVRFVKVVVCLLLSLSLTLPMLVWLAFSGHPGLTALTAAVALICATTAVWLGVATTQPSPRQDVITPPKGRALWLQLSGAVLAMLGATGVALIAYEQVGFGVFFLVVLLLGVLACFTLVDPEPAETAA